MTLDPLVLKGSLLYPLEPSLVLIWAKYGLQPTAGTLWWEQLGLDGGLSWYWVQPAPAQIADSKLHNTSNLGQIAQTGGYLL
jgi:hypothetical protein